MIRKSAVAGRFYPGTRERLAADIRSFVPEPPEQVDAIGVVAPHAGYRYSGPVAAAVFSSVQPKSAVIIIGPNHTGLGASFGLSGASAWRTPLGEIAIHRALADGIVKRSGYVTYDDLSHEGEHSVEVQLPFLQLWWPKASIVPIVAADAPLDMYRAVGAELADAVIELGLSRDTLFVASSDMTHYEPHDEARKKDQAAIEAILALDEAALFKRIAEHDISMCGYGPAAIMLAAAKRLGAKRAGLVGYRTSGDETGDYSSVVGYAGITVT